MPMPVTSREAVQADSERFAPESNARRWTVVGLLCLGIIIAYVDRTNFSVALAAKDFKDTFRLTDADRGMLNSAFFWSYAILQIPAGWIVDRYGVKIPFTLGFFAWSLVSAGTSLATSVTQLFAVRFVLGVGESVVTPAPFGTALETRIQYSLPATCFTMFDPRIRQFFTRTNNSRVLLKCFPTRSS